jgi:hypothetical protein
MTPSAGEQCPRRASLRVRLIGDVIVDYRERPHGETALTEPTQEFDHHAGQAERRRRGFS